MRRRALPKNVELAVSMMVNGGATIKALSSEFLYDLQQHCRIQRTKVSIWSGKDTPPNISRAW
jgi:hypothetical protein